MLAVGFEVEEVVDDVGCGGAEAEAEEGYDCSGDEAGSTEVGEKQREEDEDVFGPLMEADGLEPGLEGGGGLVEGVDGGDAGLAESGTEAWGGVGDHGLLAVLEEGEVGGGVADIGEVVAELGAEGGELVFAGEVELAVGGEDAGEEAQVVRDAVGGVGVGCGGKVDGAAEGVLLLKILKEFAVVGEVGYVQLYGVGEVAFEGGFALEEPAGEVQEGGRAVTRNGECRIMKGVRLDEGSVEVDAEHWQRGDVECGGRERQKCPFLRLTFYRHKKNG